MAKVKKDPNEMSFLDHLEELRWHLIRSTMAIVIIGVVAFLMKDFIFDTIIFGPKKMSFPTYRLFCDIATRIGLESAFCADELPFTIQNRTMAGQFSAHIWTSIWAGFIVGFPYVLYEMWKFISPGMYEKERKYSRGFILVASLLFFMGVLFGYYVVAPLSINFLGTYQVSKEVLNEIDISSFISTVRASVIACGIMFELPIIIFFLTKVGLVTPEILRKYRKIALVVVLTLSAVITPPDVASQIIVAEVLGVGMHRIEVDVLRLGGGFGGKEDQATPWAVMAALGAVRLQRPVKVVLHRQDDLRMTGKRHPYSTDYKIGVAKNGRIIAFESTSEKPEENRRAMEAMGERLLQPDFPNGHADRVEGIARDCGAVSVRVRPNASATNPLASTRFACVNITPFGLPVVPAV
mgnify:CR=1 FL=1